MKYSHIITEVSRTPWAIRAEKLNLITGLLSRKAAGQDISAAEIAAIKQENREPYLLAMDENLVESTEPTSESVAGEDLRILPSDCEAVFDPLPFNASVGDNTVSRSSAPMIAVLPLFGTILHRMGGLQEMSGGTSTERFANWFRSAMNDQAIKSIVIDVESPGGTVNGVPELADEIFQGRSTKNIVAVANAQAASAAYFLASQASELVAIPSAEVGSIGVFAAHMDVSKAAEAEGVKISIVSAGKYKTEANPYEPLSEEARAAIQEKVNGFYAMFVNAVARGRDTTSEEVRNGMGQGRMLLAADAKQANMVDRVATMERTLKRLGAKSRTAAMPDRMRQESESTPAHVLNQRRREREMSLYQV